MFSIAAAALRNEELANETIGLLHMICAPSRGMSATGASGQRLLFSSGGLLKLMNFVLAHATPNQEPTTNSDVSSTSRSISSDKVIVGKALALVHQLCPLQTEEPPPEIFSALSSLLHKAELSVE